MRGVWWSAFALLLLAVVTSALRTVQVEGTSRISRRHPNPDRSPTSTNKPEDLQSTLRSRTSRRGERQEIIIPRDVSRTRHRNKQGETTSTVAPDINQSERNDRFDSRRTSSRIRNKPVVNEENFDTTINREIKSRSRQSIRHVTSPSTQAPSVSSTTPSVIRTQTKVTDSTVNEVSRNVKEVTEMSKDIKRKISTARMTEIITPTSMRPRGRVNTRTNIRTLDLEVSGTANALTTAPKEQSTARTNDIRNSRKLRYRTRQSETDTNLTGDGIAISNDVRSSLTRENITSQSEARQYSSSTTEKNIRQNTSRTSVKTSTIKTTKVVKRPISRAKTKESLTVTKSKVSDEIGEDDNYPPSFKALIQAKNASTQASSPPSESLSVKASQKVFKTHPTSSQSVITAPEIEKQSRLRSKINVEDNNNEIQSDESKLVETTPATELPKARSVEYRLRGSYTARNKKSSTFSTAYSSTSTASPVTQKSFKFNRKFKATTTEAPKIEKLVKNSRSESNNLLKKSVIRSSLFTKRNTVKNFNVSTELPKAILDKNITEKGANIHKSKQTLPRTSYYSRLRSNAPSAVSSPVTNMQVVTEAITADKKTENIAETPLIYTYLNNPGKREKNINNESVENQKFMIAINSKETLENGTDNDVISNMDESQYKPVLNIIATTQKYHATYKQKNNDVTLVSKEKNITAVPPIRNIPTRKYSRKSVKNRNVFSTTTQMSKERNLKKYSDTFSKTTEASSNGILAEPEKSKTKYSSKYRASYLDKPFYKPTVPTVTSSTAWLKFFVTDHLLTKSVEEPNRFEEDFLDVTTEQMLRLNITSPICMHESALILVEGEESQLGPDMNVISFSKTRSPLMSADLRLSKNLAKPLQVMNVEASHHSPSVTVSIFDALAEILTSTPKPRISSTTIKSQIQNTNSEVKLTVNGVSSNINVNSLEVLTSKDVATSTIVMNTIAKSVQNQQTTPNVFNRVLVEGTVTPSQNDQDEKISSVNTPTILPFSTIPSTTSFSARRPFAIKVLYADTVPTTDKTTAIVTSTQPPTDSPTTVYNKVSDLILSNNKLVSSGLTSMLSENIKNIIQNMDDDSKARLSVDMVKLLDRLIPQMLSRSMTLQDDMDSIPNTTPYSLEDIKDTENININNKDSFDVMNENKINFLSGVTNSNVNSTENVSINSVVATTVPAVTVNSFSSLENLDNTLPLPESPTTNTLLFLEGKTTLPERIMEKQPLTTESIQSTVTTSFSPIFDNVMPVNNADNSVVNIEINPSVNVNAVTNKSDPIPFLTNFASNNFSLDNITNMSLQLDELENIDNVEDPSQLSRLQLWILSKKARVLKMIEDLIRNHNEEIRNAPLTELIGDLNQNNVSLSSRLSEIVSTMSPQTTISVVSDISDNNEPTSTTTTTTTTNTLITTTFSTNPSTLSSSENSLETSTIEPGNLLTTLATPLETGSTISIANETPASQTTSVIVDTFPSSTFMAIADSTTVRGVNGDMEVVDTTVTNNEIIQSSTMNNFVTTTAVPGIAAITEPSATTEINSEMTTLPGTETTTVALTSINNMTNINGVNAVSNQLNVVSSPSIPKKDYVIFGILPNNTVVRKDPNDDALESLTEASPYIIYGVLPNNTVIRKFPNGTRVPRIMQKIDILPISPWSLRNPYSPIHNIPAIVRPQSNLIRVSTNTVTSKDTANNGSENKLTSDTVNNLQNTIPSSALNIKDSSSLGITTNKLPAEISTASHVLSLRTTTMLPSVDEILLNSISSATKEEMVISSMTSSTREPRILTLDIDPETKQIRTEKPVDGNGNAVFKFIPIDEVTISAQDSNVLKLASTKMPKMTTIKEIQMSTSTIPNTLNTQNQNDANNNDESAGTKFTTEAIAELSSEVPTSEFTIPLISSTTEVAVPTESTLSSRILSTTSIPATTEKTATSFTISESSATLPTEMSFLPITTTIPTVITPVFTTTIPTTTTLEITTAQTMTSLSPSSTDTVTANVLQTAATNQKEAELLQSLLQQIGRNPKNLNILSKINEASQLNKKIILQNSNNSNNIKIQSTTIRSIEDDIRQFEEDTKLLKAILLIMGRDPNELNLPSLDSIRALTSTTNPSPTTTEQITTTNLSLPPTTEATTTTTTTSAPLTTTTTTTRITTFPTTVKTTTSSLNDDIRKLQQDTQLLQALLRATGNEKMGNLPIISGITSNVRIASNPLTTSIESNPTTPVNIRPVYTTRPSPVFTNSLNSGSITVSTLQPQQLSTEQIGISTTFRPFNERSTTTIRDLGDLATTTGRINSAQLTVSTEIPSTSTFSDEEDLLFLQNLKSVLSSKNSNIDPETALANRVIALAVERSLNEIQTGNKVDSSTTIRPSTTTTRPTTTRRTTTFLPQITTTPQLPPSLQADIKQFEEDTKLLQALLKATGQDPAKFNIPTLPSTNKPVAIPSNMAAGQTTAKPYGAKIAVKDELKNEQDDAKLLQTLIKLQDAQETTTQRSKIAITGQTSDEALKKLLQAQPSGMMPEATKSSISLSTEFGNTNDALLAALLKDQGFGPTTASSLDEQLRLSALLNQVVVTPKARRTTTPPPPPPAPRRPILDGLAWLWQQWRETAPGSGESRPNRRPTPAAKPSVTPSAATSPRVNWFGSGPFVGNADERPSSNRIPLEPPSAVTAEQGPGRGQLVSAAINVTRAFSQFLGAAIQVRHVYKEQRKQYRAFFALARKQRPTLTPMDPAKRTAMD